MKIYIVYGESSDYDYHTFENVKAFTNEEKAKTEVKRLEKAVKIARKEFKAWKKKNDASGVRNQTVWLEYVEREDAIIDRLSKKVGYENWQDTNNGFGYHKLELEE
jgi:hypothetical protein